MVEPRHLGPTCELLTAVQQDSKFVCADGSVSISVAQSQNPRGTSAATAVKHEEVASSFFAANYRPGIPQFLSFRHHPRVDEAAHAQTFREQCLPLRKGSLAGGDPLWSAARGGGEGRGQTQNASPTPPPPLLRGTFAQATGHALALLSPFPALHGVAEVPRLNAAEPPASVPLPPAVGAAPARPLPQPPASPRRRPRPPRRPPPRPAAAPLLPGSGLPVPPSGARAGGASPLSFREQPWGPPQPGGSGNSLGDPSARGDQGTAWAPPLPEAATGQGLSRRRRGRRSARPGLFGAGGPGAPGAGR